MNFSLFISHERVATTSEELTQKLAVMDTCSRGGHVVSHRFIYACWAFKV
jgi:hypothetical protein